MRYEIVKTIEHENDKNKVQYTVYDTTKEYPDNFSGYLSFYVNGNGTASDFELIDWVHTFSSKCAIARTILSAVENCFFTYLVDKIEFTAVPNSEGDLFYSKHISRFNGNTIGILNDDLRHYSIKKKDYMMSDYCPYKNAI